LDLKGHSCIVSKQKFSFSSAKAFIDATHVLHSSNNIFPKAILFDYKSQDDIKY